MLLRVCTWNVRHMPWLIPYVIYLVIKGNFMEFVVSLSRHVTIKWCKHVSLITLPRTDFYLAWEPFTRGLISRHYVGFKQSWEIWGLHGNMFNREQRQEQLESGYIGVLKR